MIQLWSVDLNAVDSFPPGAYRVAVPMPGDGNGGEEGN